MFLAVDAGGTKTRAAVVAADGHVLARSEVRAGSFTALGPDAWVQVVTEAVHACGIDGISKAWVGSAGIDTPHASDEAKARLAHAFPRVEWLVTNDAALLTACVHGACVVATAGTGSVALAYDATKTLVRRVGGLGWLLGDEGSAFGIGREALRAVLAPDAPPSTLADDICAAWNTTRTDLLRCVYDDNPKARIAGIAPLVTAAASRGDALAYGALAAQARCMAECMNEAAMSLPGTVPSCCVSGALFQVPLYRALVLAHTREWASVHIVQDMCVTAARTLYD